MRRKNKKSNVILSHKLKARQKLPILRVVTVFLIVVLSVSAVFAIKKYLRIKEVYNFKMSSLGKFKTYPIDPNSLSIDLLCFEISEGEVAKIGNLTLKRVGQWELRIPSGVYLPDEEGGYLSVEKLYAAGERLKSGKSGIEYVKERFDSVFGVEIDGYIATTRETDGISPCSYVFTHIEDRDIVLNTLAVKNLLEETFSNIDVMGLFALAKSPGESKIEVKMVDSNRCETIEYHGENVKVLNEECIDEVIRKFSRPNALKFEQARVDVYNATGVNGLAARMARRLKNSGLEVVRIEDAPTYVEKTQIYVTKGNSFSKTVEVVRDQLGVDDVEVSYTPTPFVSTGDVVVLLGKDSIFNF